MKIKREELYDFIRSQTNGECYVGLHGIADSSDLKNEYSDLPKVEKAKSIMEKGLINARGKTISLTAKFFGGLDPDDEESALTFNNYRFYSPSGEQVIVVISIPLFFENSKGQNIFCGYKEFRTPEAFKTNEVPECISDDMFKRKIPPEFMLGFYTFNDDDDEAEYTPNANYYTGLPQERKDALIDYWFKSELPFDVNSNEAMERVRKAGRILNPLYGAGPRISPVLHTVDQYDQLLYERENSHKGPKQ